MNAKWKTFACSRGRSLQRHCLETPQAWKLRSYFYFTETSYNRSVSHLIVTHNSVEWVSSLFSLRTQLLQVHHTSKWNQCAALFIIRHLFFLMVTALQLPQICKPAELKQHTFLNISHLSKPWYFACSPIPGFFWLMNSSICWKILNAISTSMRSLNICCA